MYFRATPHQNSEDAVIFQEYTLYNVEDCGHQLKIILTDGSYSPGDYNVGLFGIEYQPIPEVVMTISDWQAQYGNDTQPQKGDIIYIMRPHKIYEVGSSTVVYAIQSMPTHYKLSLTKYTPTASRRENPDLKQSLEEMTVSQEDLFGDIISQEVADTVAEVETSLQQTSYVSPQKDFDMGCVVTEELIGPHNNHISNAYYDFRIAEEPVIYHSKAIYDPECPRIHWIYTCWLRHQPASSKVKDSPVRSLTFYFQDAKYRYYTIETSLKLTVGNVVTLSRGKFISVDAEVCELPNDCSVANGIGLRIKLSESIRLDRKHKDWASLSNMRIQKSPAFDIISSDNNTFNIHINPISNTISFVFGEFSKDVALSKQVNWNGWNYLAIDFSPAGAALFMQPLMDDDSGDMFVQEFVKANTRKPGEFSFEELSIPAVKTGLNIRNIRLYENEYEMTTETAMLDAMSEVTRNASKLIITDAPNVKNPADFYSPAR